MASSLNFLQRKMPSNHNQLKPNDPDCEMDDTLVTSNTGDFSLCPSSTNDGCHMALYSSSPATSHSEHHIHQALTSQPSAHDPTTTHTQACDALSFRPQHVSLPWAPKIPQNLPRSMAFQLTNQNSSYAHHSLVPFCHTPSFTLFDPFTEPGPGQSLLSHFESTAPASPPLHITPVFAGQYLGQASMSEGPSTIAPVLANYGTQGSRITQTNTSGIPANSLLHQHPRLTPQTAFKNELVCPTCGQVSTCNHNHQNHLRTHTGEKPFLCKVPGCMSRFSRHAAMLRHMGTVHKIADIKQWIAVFEREEELRSGRIDNNPSTPQPQLQQVMSGQNSSSSSSMTMPQTTMPPTIDPANRQGVVTNPLTHYYCSDCGFYDQPDTAEKIQLHRHLMHNVPFSPACTCSVCTEVYRNTSWPKTSDQHAQPAPTPGFLDMGTIPEEPYVMDTTPEHFQVIETEQTQVEAMTDVETARADSLEPRHVDSGEGFVLVDPKLVQQSPVSLDGPSAADTQSSMYHYTDDMGEDMYLSDRQAVELIENFFGNN